MKPYSYWELMGMLTNKRVFVLRDGECYFFAQIVN